MREKWRESTTQALFGNDVSNQRRLPEEGRRVLRFRVARKGITHRKTNILITETGISNGYPLSVSLINNELRQHHIHCPGPKRRFSLVLWKPGTTKVQQTPRPNTNICFINKHLCWCENRTRDPCFSTGVLSHCAKQLVG
ncbi:hypothetical protein EVAR_84600_1 [Eumeta japonica]|uniref:Uncharacterized protein n=1 Tax=Eumeta variegata TaxID=151549 RepID=A0A4C1ZFB6_EUMVA|nr:hypothetical protein EVAR_84600_1 [Eumeta japonica]